MRRPFPLLLFCFAVACGDPGTSGTDAAPDAGEVADVGPADASDAGSKDMGPHDSGEPDSGEPDSGEPDSGDVGTDGGESDGGDAGEPDGGDEDGSVDAGMEVDAGVADAAMPDAGEVDAGSVDAGAQDSGQLTCATLTSTAYWTRSSTTGLLFCDDFTETSTAYQVFGGSWSIQNERLVVTATAADAACGISQMAGIVYQPIVARDVAISVQMTSIARADKILILRSAGAGDRIELNFRAQFSTPIPGDLVVQELNQCVSTGLTSEGQVIVPHQYQQPIRADLMLVDDQLSVFVDGNHVLTSTFAFSEREGQVGFGVIQGGTAQFDNLLIEVLGSTVTSTRP